MYVYEAIFELGPDDKLSRLLHVLHVRESEHYPIVCRDATMFNKMIF